MYVGQIRTWERADEPEPLIRGPAPPRRRVDHHARAAECRALIRRLSLLDGWKDRHVVAALASLEEIRHAGEVETGPDAGAEHCIPGNVLDRLDAF